MMMMVVMMPVMLGHRSFRGQGADTACCKQGCHNGDHNPFHDVSPLSHNRALLIL
jgi:hypothetical protein